MRVVSNTSPISNLAIIGRLDLLKLRYGTVWIPPAVAAELSRLGHAAAKQSISSAIAEGWLVQEKQPVCVSLPAHSLDSGEADAIALALALHADVLLMDERRGRAVARQSGLVVAGVLGELLHAKLKGRIAAVEPELLRLRKEAGFFVGAEVQKFILSQAGEQ